VSKARHSEVKVNLGISLGLILRILEVFFGPFYPKLSTKLVFFFLARASNQQVACTRWTSCCWTSYLISEWNITLNLQLNAFRAPRLELRLLYKPFFHSVSWAPQWSSRGVRHLRPWFNHFCLFEPIEVSPQWCWILIFQPQQFWTVWCLNRWDW